MRTELLNNGGKFWQKIGDNYIKGYAFINNDLLDEQAIYSELIKSIQVNLIQEKLLQLNGNFSCVIKYNDKIYLIADKLKSYPLLYAKINGDWVITDQARSMMDALSEYKPDEIAIVTYLSLGYLHGNQTFLENCKIVVAGTWVELEEKDIAYTYHKHIYPKVNLSDEAIMAGCVHSLENAIKRMLQSIGDRPIWIPLSGGYDSRLLACVLKKLDAKNVSCFTYGIPESYEVKISRQVAQTLNFPWYYVEYTEEKFLAVANSPMDDDYIYWAMNLNTTSHFQDFIAFKELRERRIIEDNAVVVPGHSGEILGRDQIPYQLLESNKSVAELLYYRYFQWNIPKKKSKKIILNDLGQELNITIAKEDKSRTIDLFSNWNIQNRQANFIVNAVRIYEYFGVDWRIPLWDDELSYFWFSLPWTKNANVILYNQFMFEQYFIPMKVAIYKEKIVSRNLMAKIRLPFGIKSKIKKELSKLNYFKTIYDFNGLNYRASYYLNKINDVPPKQIILKKTDTNAVITYYEIFLIKKYFALKEIKNDQK